MPPPPPGPPWDLPFAETPFVFVDLEMTGLDAELDRVIEICAVRVVGGEVRDELLTLVSPGERPDRAAHVHGIAAEDLAVAPPFTAVAPALSRVLDGAVLVAHAAMWDVRFLAAEFARAELSFACPHFLDTLVLSRRSFALPSHSLDALCTHFGIVRARAHRAQDDVLALREVFARCVAALDPQTPRDLLDVRIAEGKAREQVLAACEAARASGAPVRITYRPSRKPAEEVRAVVTEIRATLDPPRVLCYLHPGRGRRELRADRILRVEPGE